MHIVIALIESVIALGIFVLVYRFVGRFFRRRRPEESDEGGPMVTVPLGPRTPRRSAKAAVEEPDEPDMQE